MDIAAEVRENRVGHSKAAAKRYRWSGTDRDATSHRQQQGEAFPDTPEMLAARTARLVQRNGLPVEAALEATRTEALDRPMMYERILGVARDLQAWSFLPRGVRAARTVARISVRENGREIPIGTGFLVSPRLLLTNHHVFPDAGVARSAVVEFDAQVTVDNTPEVSRRFVLAPDAFFVADQDLDFALVPVVPDSTGLPVGETFGWNRLSVQTGKLVIGEPVNIIGHPSGRLKEISIRENRLEARLDDFLQYQTDTEPGNSGSPVFNDQWEVTALHHSGVPRTDDRGRILRRDGQIWREGDGDDAVDWVSNEGVRVSVILKHLAALPLDDARLAFLTEMGPESGLQDIATVRSTATASPSADGRSATPPADEGTIPPAAIEPIPPSVGDGQAIPPSEDIRAVPPQDTRTVPPSQNTRSEPPSDDTRTVPPPEDSPSVPPPATRRSVPTPEDPRSVPPPESWRSVVPSQAGPPVEASVRATPLRTGAGLPAAPDAFGGAKHLVFLHGRGHEECNPEEVRRNWAAGLNCGLTRAGLATIVPADACFPFYGRRLVDAMRPLEALHRSPRVAVGDPVEAAAPAAGSTRRLYEQLIVEAAARAGLPPARATSLEGLSDAVHKGLSWLADTTDLDRLTIAAVFGDVAAYLDDRRVREAVLDCVLQDMPRSGHLVLVSHSLGTVVAMDLLTRLDPAVEVDLLVTAGSPLGLDSVFERLISGGPYRPDRVARWFNAWCPIDPVAIGCPLGDRWQDGPDEAPVVNATGRAHDIDEYLAHAEVAQEIGISLCSPAWTAPHA
ncbi:trypsin-like serine peptidase [Nonomuraea fuscirosea]|uniref:trypsin-like serine peptidase n=1 Tax=Nonomuraea fuscirosea TaxID=1291556 RepID=UPI003419EE63